MRALLIAVTALIPGSVLAQDVGDPARGLAYARQACGECHATELGEKGDSFLAVPSFQEIANTTGMSEIALISFFQTPHPSMPNLIVPADDARDVIAYILSLKR